jgi:uncharacterized protein YecT (DUF1311 family)
VGHVFSFLGLLAFFCLSSAAWAEEDVLLEPPYGASEAEIKEASLNCQRNEIAISICAWRAFMDSDTELKKAGAALASVPEMNIGALNKAQLAFIAFRNATCDFDMLQIGGSMGWSVAYGCRTQYNERRTEALKNFLACFGQDCELPVLLYSFDK